jgi:hypothetical protein
MRSYINRLILLLVTILVAGGGTVVAQERAAIQALATVVSSLSIIGTNNLQFGTVTPGITKSVDKATIGFAGEWEITGTSAAELTMDFTLPDTMRTVDSLGRMRIDFSATDVSFSDGTGNQTTPTGTLNPNGPSVRRIGGGGMMTVWIGGTVYPRVSQTGGDYSAEIMLTVAYTGS